MTLHLRVAGLLVFLFGTPLGLYGCASPMPYVAPDFLTELLTLNTPNYTGGLTHQDQVVAERIHAALLPRYYTDCGDPNPFAGALVSFGGDFKKPLPSLVHVDPDLAFLIRALDNPSQEVRDVAAYTIGLLGPSANAAQIFLERKFSTQEVKGGWYGVGLEKISCQPVGSMSVRNAIPDSIRMQGPLADKGDAYIVASLYLNPNIVYPPGLLSLEFESVDQDPSSGGPLLVKILENDGLGTRKQREAAKALAKVPETFTREALPALLRLAESGDARLRYAVTTALVRIHHERAIPLLTDWIGDESWEADWQRHLCSYGKQAISTEDRLIEILQRSTVWPSVQHKIVETLGCIQSAKSIPLLISYLNEPDWVLNLFAAKGLGEIGQPGTEVFSALTRVMREHWSARVRLGAFNALQKLGASPSPIENISDHVKDDVDPEVIGVPYPFDHGLHWCDETGQYSIDGTTWFTVKWIQPTLEPIPRRFRPNTDLLVQTIGTQTFLRVDDGWLFGSVGFESEGVLAHVSDAGKVTVMEGEFGLPFGHASIVSIVKRGGRYFAAGFEILKLGSAGVLLELSKNPAGTWSSKRVTVLPSPPALHALAPTGELLLSDGPNDYAVVGSRIVPLHCEKTRPGSFFATP